MSTATTGMNTIKPNVMRVGRTRTMIVNYKEICEGSTMDPTRLMEILCTRLKTTGNIDMVGRLLLRGQIHPKRIEDILLTILNSKPNI